MTLTFDSSAVLRGPAAPAIAGGWGAQVIGRIFLWPLKARSLYFTANFFHFVSIDERPAMGSQPNLVSRSEVVSIYKCPPTRKKNLGLSSHLGRKKHQIFDNFFASSALDTAYLRNETSHRQKLVVSIYNVP